MKLYKLALLLLAFSLTFSATTIFAQDDDDDEMEEMDEEEWQRQMDELTARKNDLMNQLNSLNADVDALKKMNKDKDAELEKAENDLYGSVGATKSQVADYRRKFEALEKKINSKSGSKEDAEKEFAEIEASKIRCLPEFWDRYQAMKKKLAEWGGSAGTYTVVKGDCLSKIAGMSNIYNNWKLWPALWEANKNGVVSAPARTPKTIPNPNLIYPGQVLRIPTMTEELKNKTLKTSWRRYYKPKTRMKKTTETKKEEDMKK